MRAVVAAGLVAGALSQGYPKCLDRYQCIFHADIGGSEYSWDLSGLCRGRGRGEYTVQIPNSDGYVSFNICGNVTSRCSYEPNTPLYSSRGTAIQYVSGWADDSSRYQPATLDGNPCPPAKLAANQTGCYDWDFFPATVDGGMGCCTDPCEVIASGPPQWSLLDTNNAKGGLQFRYLSEGALADDPFDCGFDKTGKLKIQRQTTVNLYCGSAPDGTIGSISVSEVSTCHYLIQGTSPAACGVNGDPYDGYNNNPGDLFGYTVLGSVLTVFVQYAWAFADARGWTDPITRRIPPMSSIPGYDRVASLFGGKGGYAAKGGFASVGAATPITQGAYGSA